MTSVAARQGPRRCLPWVLAVLLSLWIVPPARAEDAATTATRLFEAGRGALERGDLDVACSSFANSQKLDPRVGTLLNLALCHEARGMLVRALSYWRQAQQLAAVGGDDRIAVARDRAAKLEPRVPILTVRLAASAPPRTTVHWQDPHGVERGPLSPDELGRPLQVDPGKVQLFVEAPEHERRVYEVELAERDREKVEVDVGPGQAAPTEPSDGGAPVRDAGLIIGAVGLVGLGVGAIFGGRAVSKQGESEEADATGVPRCDANNACSPEGLELRDDAIQAATVSTVAFVIGGVLVAGGIVLVLVAPESADDSAGVAAAPSLRLRGQPGHAALELVW